MEQKRGAWKNKLGFILAAAGSAVGLGNLWKFPYLTYKHGGGTDGHGAGGFVLIYIISVLVIGLPIMLAEIFIGKRGKKNPVGAFTVLKPNSAWKAVGAMGIITGFILLSYYAIVAGWTLQYGVFSASFEFDNYKKNITQQQLDSAIYKKLLTFESSDMLFATLTKVAIKPECSFLNLYDLKIKAIKTEAKYKKIIKSIKSSLENNKNSECKKIIVASATKTFTHEEKNKIGKSIYPNLLFKKFIASPEKQIMFFFIFMLLTLLVVIGGVSGGIEKWTKILMPLLLGILTFLLVRSLMLPGSKHALTYLFSPDFSTVNAQTVLEAMGQAFFSLSLGMGAMITYGSYLSDKDKITYTGASVAVLDSIVAIAASIIIFSAIFTYNLKMEGGGIGNLFTALPVIFMHITGGKYLLILFYLLVIFAALTSTISLLEVVVSYLIDEKAWSRKKASILASLFIFILGIPSALSFNLMSKITAGGRTFFDWMDYLCANWFLPLGGLFIAIFVGWVANKKDKKEEVSNSWLLTLWDISLKIIAPAAVLAVIIGMMLGGIQS